MSEPSAKGTYSFTFTPDFSRPVQPAGAWVTVSDGDLPAPVTLRINRASDGRYVVTGLMIGDEMEPREITSQTLRQLRLREIVAALLADYDPDAPPDWLLPAAFGVVIDANARAGQSAKPRTKGPDDEALKAFAHTYQTEMARRPQRAMSTAAELHGISRATAHRWADLCRERGYLPSRGS